MSEKELRSIAAADHDCPETNTAFDPEKVSRYYNGHNELKNCATNEPLFMESNPDTIMVQASDYDKLLELYREATALIEELKDPPNS